MAKGDDDPKKRLRDNTHHDPKPDEAARRNAAPRGSLGYGPPTLTPGGSGRSKPSQHNTPPSVPVGPTSPTDHLTGASASEPDAKVPVAPKPDYPSFTPQYKREADADQGAGKDKAAKKPAGISLEDWQRAAEYARKIAQDRKARQDKAKDRDRDDEPER